MAAPIILTPFVRGVKEFQQLGLMNKAVLDATAVDIPVIGLSKNQTERKERFLRQALILVIAFLFAPIHGKLISQFLSKRIGFRSAQANQILMQIPYGQLVNAKTLKNGIRQLLSSHAVSARLSQTVLSRANEALRLRVVKAKTAFLMADMVVCGLLMCSIGYIKVLFGKFLSGKSQFTGEQGIVSEQSLDKLYEKDASFERQKKIKTMLTFGLGVGVPITLGLLLRNVLKISNPRGLASFVATKVGPWLDYNYPQYLKKLRGWPLLSDGAQIVLSALLTTGELASARSKRELKELAIQRNSIDALFFFGTPMLMKALSGSTTVQGAIDRVTSRRPKLVRAAASRAAKTYLLSYTLASLAVAGIILWTNKMTRKAVQDEAKQL